MSGHLYLRKANDDLLSHCNCDRADAWISSPGQMDCPWCGCGWLFICGKCRKAFTFAEAAWIDEPWEETGDRTIRALYNREPEPGETMEWVSSMQILLKDAHIRANYVYFDGHVIPTDAEGVKIEGWHSNHDLGFVPQVKALTDPTVRDELLCSRNYWLSNRVEGYDCG